MQKKMGILNTIPDGIFMEIQKKIMNIYSSLMVIFDKKHKQLFA